MQAEDSDLEQLRVLLSLAEKGFYPMQKALMLFGDTGAGKSTMTNILAARTLESIRRAIKQLVEEEPQISTDNMRSCTRRPVLIQTPHCFLIDTPGDGDTGDQNVNKFIQRIANLYYNYRVPKEVQEIAFLYVTPMAAITMSRSQLFTKSLQVFADTVTDVSILEHSFAIMVTQISNADDDKEYIIEELTKILNSDHIGEKAKQLLGFGLKNLTCYYKPTLGQFKNETLLPEVIQNLQFLDMNANRQHFKMTLSDDLIQLAEELFNKSKETLTNELVGLVDLVKTEYIDNPSLYEDEQWVRKVVIKMIKVPNSSFFDMFSSGYTMKQVEEERWESVKTVYKVQDMDCMAVMTDLCEQIVSGQFTLDTLYENSQGMIRLLQKKDANNEKDEAYTKKQTLIVETIQFAKFLQHVSLQKNLDLAELQRIFGDVLLKLNQAKDSLLQGFQDIPGGQTKGYYDIIIKLYDVERYKNLPQNILKLAKCNYELGMIQFKENNIPNATSLYHKALLLDPNASTFPQVYSQLADCYYLDTQSIVAGTPDCFDKTLAQFQLRLQNTFAGIKTQINDNIGLDQYERFSPLEYLENLYEAICFLKPHQESDLCSNSDVTIVSFSQLLLFINRIAVQRIEQETLRGIDPQEQANEVVTNQIFLDLKTAFQRDIAAFKHYDAQFLNNGKAGQLNTWFKESVQQLFTDLQGTYITKAVQTDTSQTEVQDLNRLAKILARLPKIKQARINSSLIYLNLYQKAQADQIQQKIVFLEKSLEFDVTNRKTRRNLADLQKSQNDYKKAFEQYRKIPHTTKAEKCLQSLVDQDKENYNLLIQLGEYQLEVHQTSDAIRSFRVAKDLLHEAEQPDADTLKRVYQLMKDAREGKETGQQLDHLIANPLQEMAQEIEVQEESKIQFD